MKTWIWEVQFPHPLLEWFSWTHPCTVSCKSGGTHINWMCPQELNKPKLAGRRLQEVKPQNQPAIWNFYMGDTCQQEWSEQQHHCYIAGHGLLAEMLQVIGRWKQTIHLEALLPIYIPFNSTQRYIKTKNNEMCMADEIFITKKFWDRLEVLTL